MSWCFACCRWLIYVVVTSFFALASYAESTANFNTVFSKDVASMLNDKSIPGAAYVIVEHGEIKALETFGHLAKGSNQAVTPTTVFRLASVSKPFASTLTAQLALEGKINLQAPVTHFLPEFSLKQAGQADEIKVHHLLSHTSGLLPNTYDNLLHENWSMEKIIGRFDRLAPICQPAKCYGYQNIMYGFLQDVIEASQPQPYEQVLADKIFTPLDMQQASVGLTAFRAQGNTAKPHILIRKKKTNKSSAYGKPRIKYTWKQVQVNSDFYKVPAAAGVNASILDMAKWLNANMGYQPDVLSPELLDRVTTPFIRTKRDLKRRYWRDFLTDAHYGYGWRIYQIDQQDLIYHGGWVEGFRADIGYMPELGIGFAILINAESNVISEISARFWQQIAERSAATPANQQHMQTP
ncbi:serine hydrolase domain-containing protein [Thalassotalea sp. LPB0316]|uniref:serine hydrolase domain-containing protein n=1 Tax=Thalassotalea sp. LPB0316 TaxID=2769490 RepID=UPI001D05601F|nr:serine hydrolase domain-containing protein [Thalassotalea sp. LPB0316]